MKRIVVYGATSEIAHQLTRLLAQNEECSFVLIGRNKDRLDTVCKDLKSRGAQSAEFILCDFLNKESLKHSFMEALLVLKEIDTLILAQGSLTDQLKANTDIDYALDEFFLNFESMAIPALLGAEYFEKRQKGQIIGISSVAGERGRKTIYLYGSAKSAFTSLMSGLRGRLAPHNIHVMTVKPGLIETPMTSHLPKSPLFISSISAANIIYKGMINRKDSIYVPFYWRFIMRIIKDLPEFIFKKLSI